jgi:plasmid replication initiation protein
MSKKYNLDLYKHNDFIKMVQVKKQMSFQQQRIFDTLLATVQEMKKTGEFVDVVSEGELKIDLTTFKEQMLKGSKIKKINRKELENALETMVDIKFKYSIKENDQDKIGTFVIFQKAEIDFNTNEVSVVFGKEFRTENLLPTSNYTAMSLEFLNTFSSQYARLLYQYLKMLIGKDYNKPFRTDIKLEIKFIKSLFGINEIEHKMYSKNTSVMLKNTIEPAVLQINKFSDINVSFEKIKRGNRIFSLEFKFTPKSEYLKRKPVNINDDNLSSPLNMPEFKIFKEFRKWILENYKNKDIIIGPVGYLANTTIKISQAGYLHNNINSKDLAPDDAQFLWNWMFDNQDRIGKVNLSEEEVFSLNNYGKFLYVFNKEKNIRINSTFKKIVLKDKLNYDVFITLDNGEDKVVSNFFSIESLSKELKELPLGTDGTIDAIILN